MRPNKQTLLFLLLSTILTLSCYKKNQTEDNNTLYAIPKEEKLDSISAWFSNEDNFKDKTYLEKFYYQFGLLEEKQNWEKAAQLLFFVGQAVYVHRQSDRKLIEVYNVFLKKHESQIPDKYRSGLYLNLGLLYHYDSKFSESIAVLEKVSQIKPRDYTTLVNVSTACNELAYSYSELGKYDKALHYVFRAIKGSKALNDTLGLGAAYDAAGTIYRSINDFSNAEYNMNKAVETLNSMKQYNGVLEVYLNKLDMYAQLNNPATDSLSDVVYKYYLKHDFKNDFYKVSAFTWKAQASLNQKKLLEAEKLLNEIRPIFEKAEEKFIYSKYIETATRFDKLANKKSISSNIYAEAIPKYKEENNLLGLLSCYQALKEEAFEKKDFPKALEFSEAYEQTNDSLTSKALLFKAKELDKQYQTEKKEQEIALQKGEIEQKNTYIALLVSSLGGLLLAVFAFTNWNRQKRLKQEKTNSMKFTKQLLQSTEEERKRIAGDLHDSISHELLNLKSIFSQDISVVNSKIDTIIDDIRGISRNLHPVMFDKIGLVPNIEQLIERVQNQSNFFVSTDINYAGSLTSADELQIYRITQEALTNIIKYSKAHAAKISILEHPSHIAIEIKDNGKGFNVKETLNSGKAFGLHNIIERSRAIGGEATITSSNEGTQIEITIAKKP